MVTVKQWAILGGVAAGAVALWALVRRKAGESFAQSLGKLIGESTINVGAGAVKGAYGAAQGVAGSILDAVGLPEPEFEGMPLPPKKYVSGDFEISPVPGRSLGASKNVLGLQGKLYKAGPGQYVAEVQNQGAKPVASGLFEIHSSQFIARIGYVTLSPGTGIKAEGSVAGALPARLYGAGFLLDKLEIVL